MSKIRLGLTIPEADRPRLASLLALEPTTLSELRAALEVAAPCLLPKALSRSIQSRLPLAQDALVDVIRLLVTLHWLCFNEDLETEILAKDLQAAAEDLGMTPPVAGWPTFTTHLVSLLRLDTLRITSKAAYVAQQYPRHLLNARVFTDARPVYSEAIPSGPPAFIITHSLQLQVHEDDCDKDYYLTLGGSDLHDLREAVERALDKEKSLQERLKDAGFSIVETKEWSE